MRGLTMPWKYYLNLNSICCALITVHLESHSCFFLVIMWTLLQPYRNRSQSSPWQGPCLMLRPVAAEAVALQPLRMLRILVVCEACAVLKLLPPPVECSTGCVGRGASLKGEEERGRGREKVRGRGVGGDDLWKVLSESYDSIFVCGNKMRRSIQ